MGAPYIYTIVLLYRARFQRAYYHCPCSAVRRFAEPTAIDRRRFHRHATSPVRQKKSFVIATKDFLFFTCRILDVDEHRTSRRTLVHLVHHSYRLLAFRRCQQADLCEGRSCERLLLELYIFSFVFLYLLFRFVCYLMITFFPLLM